MDEPAFDRVRSIAIALPGVSERVSHGEPCFFISAEPERFFKPPMSASGTFSGWLGVFLDTTGDDAVDWDEIAAIVEDAYRLVAPKALIAQLDARR